MSEVAIREQGAIALPTPDDTYDRLARWAQSAQAAHQVAGNLVQTSFVPQAFRNKPMEATAAILAGAEVGLSPMASLRSFDVIQGTAAARALTLRAIVQSRGHEIWVKESTATRAIVCGRRRGETNVHTSTWVIERAKQLGLTGKDNWKNQPTAMLLARATAECARMVAADAILGIPYAAEELEDGDVLREPISVPEAVVGDPEPPKRTAQRTRNRPAPAPAAPVAEPEPDFDDAPPSGATMISPAQSKMLHALLNKAGKGDRAEGLKYISDVLGRTVESTKDLTMRDAGQVIDSLTAEPDEPTLDGDWPPASEVKP